MSARWAAVGALMPLGIGMLVTLVIAQAARLVS
jgi:hypothetical protein